MTIKELINELSKYNPNQKVFINSRDNKTFDVEDIDVNCDADYNDILLMIKEIT